MPNEASCKPWFIPESIEQGLIGIDLGLHADGLVAEVGFQFPIAPNSLGHTVVTPFGEANGTIFRHGQAMKLGFDRRPRFLDRGNRGIRNVRQGEVCVYPDQVQLAPKIDILVVVPIRGIGDVAIVYGAHPESQQTIIDAVCDSFRVLDDDDADYDSESDYY